MRKAAKIIAEDISVINSEKNLYPPPDEFFNSLESVIPQSLFIFVETVVHFNKREVNSKWLKIIIAISHAIMYASRPRHFRSPLLLGLSVSLYHLFGSKNLIHILSSLGFCVSYDETSLFQTSLIINCPKPKFHPYFSQFVFDNADHNVNTINGLNTFHYMGGIRCVIPDTSIKHEKFARLSKLPTSNAFLKDGIIQVQQFFKNPKKPLRQDILKKFENWDLQDYRFIDKINASDGDFFMYLFKI